MAGDTYLPVGITHYTCPRCWADVGTDRDRASEHVEMPSNELPERFVFMQERSERPYRIIVGVSFAPQDHSASHFEARLAAPSDTVEYAMKAAADIRRELGGGSLRILTVSELISFQKNYAEKLAELRSEKSPCGLILGEGELVRTTDQIDCLVPRAGS
ncbi:MAG: hypothetical protein KKF56_04525 [Nanoarchaeota archaeon]|nr:hypothetical protein [Nanoarchaeota archaeon]